MKIKNIDFGNCLLSSGALNFFGDGYWYDDYLRAYVRGFRAIDKISFVSKTGTLDFKAGNMPLDENFQPRERKPKCIKVCFFQGVILNAVGLSNPGFSALLKDGRWQEVLRPLFISVMAIGDSAAKRIEEVKKILELLADYKGGFKVPIGVQINVSCPNTKHNPKDLAKESTRYLELAAPLGWPVDLKINTLVGNEVVREIQDSHLCDVLTISNTIPYGTPGIDWIKLFGQGGSPLAEFGGGGLSGKPILPLVLRRISELRSFGITLPIKGSGGILHARDVDAMKAAGANAVEIGSALILRFWRVKRIIDRANQIF